MLKHRFFGRYFWALACAGAVLCFATIVHADDLYVTPAGKAPAPAGKVFHTIQAAITAAQPGDTIRLDPKGSPYRQIAVFNNKSGQPGKPIVLDGQGSTLLGCDPINPDQWTDQGNGLWKSAGVAAQLRMPRSLLGRFFIVFGDRPQYMGGASKAHAPTLKPPGALKPGEWTYDGKEKALYIRIPPDQTLSQARVEIPVRSAGVALRGSCSNIVIRNLKAGRVWNDGFNIHGHCTDVAFERIEAFECGDDGISAHDECSISVDGFVSRGNSNGICHVGHSRSTTSHALIVASRAYDLYLLDPSTHELRDVVIKAGAPRGICLTRNTHVTMDHVLIESAQDPVKLTVSQGALVKAEHCIFWNTDLDLHEGSLTLTHSAVGGERSQVHLRLPCQWQAEHNLWHVRQFIDDRAGANATAPVDRPFTMEEAIKFTGIKASAAP